MKRYKRQFFTESNSKEEFTSLFNNKSKGKIELSVNDTLSYVSYSRVVSDSSKIVFMSSYSSGMYIYFKDIDSIYIKKDNCTVYYKDNVVFEIEF
jgi:hypothetical protein